MSNHEAKLNQFLNLFLKSTQSHGIILHIYRDSHDPITWIGAAGNLDVATPYFLTSVAKLHITAITLKLRVQGKLDLDWKIHPFLPEEWTHELHIWKKRDYSREIRIRHLLSHSSGLPDYFDFKQNSGLSLLDELKNGRDKSWTINDILQWVKKMEPKFAPGSKNKAYYADTNFQLLVFVLEKIAGKPIEPLTQNLHDKVLGVSERYLYTDPMDRTPSIFYSEEKPLLIPKAMCAFGPDGGMVGTAKSSMVFLKAFFHAQLFPKEYLPEIQQWKSLGNGHFYGLGISKFQTSGIKGFLKPAPYLIGHAGMSGSFAFYMPEKHLFFTGTINQLKGSSLLIQLIQKAAMIFDQ
ncbi:serine hydrolase domain-containing protein [Pleomorphovibrio marinus]|uniref:serine hydrolase domain-containing protein n=1 Tax=Pleomorphovibrio marinus TaxID=2164132 RepID=UPI00130070DD|nr:serine hydrolase domain-containing protein [Pleomorphovibrio marinus]